MKCKIEIKMDNAAFEDPGELARILRKMADHCDGRTFDEDHAITCRDSNGNTVGTWEITE